METPSTVSNAHFNTLTRFTGTNVTKEKYRINKGEQKKWTSSSRRNYEKKTVYFNHRKNNHQKLFYFNHRKNNHQKLFILTTGKITTKNCFILTTEKITTKLFYFNLRKNKQGTAQLKCCRYTQDLLAHWHIGKRKGSAVGNHLKNNMERSQMSFKNLRKCQNKLDCMRRCAWKVSHGTE